MNIRQWLLLARHQLVLAHETKAINLCEPADHQAQREAEILLCGALKKPRSYLRSHDDEALPIITASLFVRFLQLRCQGHPVAYILGHQAFYDHDFSVNASTLIPRADTETIIEAIQALALTPKTHALDLGCGSGIIGLTLQSLNPDWVVYLSDISKAALAVAEYNAKKLHLHSTTILQSNWLERIPRTQRFELIVSNPPYVESAHPLMLEGDVRHEPRSALTSGADGLDAIKQIIPRAKQHLAPNGWLCFEHGYEQASSVSELLSAHQYSNVHTHKDLAGQDRVTLGQLH